jgi:L-ascorbate metabolism protein UlaG (beta-lactamase superfamily)
VVGRSSPELVDALVESGFVDRHPDHRLVVHDWHEHADAPTHMAIARRREFFRTGEAPNLTRLPAAEDDGDGVLWWRSRGRKRTAAHGARTAYLRCR